MATQKSRALRAKQLCHFSLLTVVLSSAIISPIACHSDTREQISHQHIPVIYGTESAGKRKIVQSSFKTQQKETQLKDDCKCCARRTVWIVDRLFKHHVRVNLKICSTLFLRGTVSLR